MKRLAMTLALTLVLGALAGLLGARLLHAQQAGLTRTPLLDTGLAGTAGQEAHIWVAEIAPGAATGRHYHPTPRFVYVREGSVTLEVEERPPRTFRAGEVFQELPKDAHG